MVRRLSEEDSFFAHPTERLRRHHFPHRKEKITKWYIISVFCILYDYWPHCGFIHCMQFLEYQCNTSIQKILKTLLNPSLFLLPGVEISPVDRRRTRSHLPSLSSLSPHFKLLLSLFLPSRKLKGSPGWAKKKCGRRQKKVGKWGNFPFLSSPSTKNEAKGSEKGEKSESFVFITRLPPLSLFLPGFFDNVKNYLLHVFLVCHPTHPPWFDKKEAFLKVPPRRSIFLGPGCQWGGRDGRRSQYQEKCCKIQQISQKQSGNVFKSFFLVSDTGNPVLVSRLRGGASGRAPLTRKRLQGLFSLPMVVFGEGGGTRDFMRYSHNEVWVGRMGENHQC